MIQNHTDIKDAKKDFLNFLGLVFWMKILGNLRARKIKYLSISSIILNIYQYNYSISKS